MSKKLLCALVLLGLGLSPAVAQDAEPAQQASPSAERQQPQEVSEEVNQVPAELANPQFHSRTQRYLLRPNDVLELKFAFTPEFEQVVTVQPDGFVTLKEIGDVHVQGKTVPEFKKILQESYTAILHEPVITVVLKDFEKPYFIAGGQVTNPGKYDLRGTTSLTEAIAIAGGFRDTAKHSEVLLFRRVSDDLVEARKIDVKKMLARGDLAEDHDIRPGDMLYVPKNRVSKVRQWIPLPGLTFNPF